MAVDEAFGFLVMQVATHPILTHVGYAGQRSRYTAPWLAEPHAGYGLRGQRWCRRSKGLDYTVRQRSVTPCPRAASTGLPFAFHIVNLHVRCGTSETCRSLSGQRASPAIGEGEGPRWKVWHLTTGERRNTRCGAHPAALESSALDQSTPSSRNWLARAAVIGASREVVTKVWDAYWP